MTVLSSSITFSHDPDSCNPNYCFLIILASSHGIPMEVHQTLPCAQLSRYKVIDDVAPFSTSRRGRKSNEKNKKRKMMANKKDCWFNYALFAPSFICGLKRRGLFCAIYFGLFLVESVWNSRNLFEGVFRISINFRNHCKHFANRKCNNLFYTKSSSWNVLLVLTARHPTWKCFEIVTFTQSWHRRKVRVLS